MATLLDDRGIAQRVFDHIEAGTTDMSEVLWREPVENYRSEARLAAEIERVLRRTPTAFCPSAALPEPGAYVAREAAGTPLVVVRGSDGVVRGFRNACRHRGTQVAEGSGCAKALVCRYHGWTYALDGRLDFVPHEHGFPGLDREKHGLAPVRVRERSGLVFVTQDPPGPDDRALEELPELIGKDQRLFASRESCVPANWKIFLEGFLEGYHIRSTHPKTFYPYGFDNLNVIEYFGRNSRVTFPFQRIRKLADLPPEERRVEGAVTYVYQLFPNTVVVVLSHHTLLSVLEPVSPSETRLVSYALTNRPAADPEAVAAAQRDAAFVNQTGGAEDMAVVCSIQKSLGSGANDAFTYGRFEGAIAHFHRSLDAALESGRV
jgi:phenylpropionate dioxygenase-like ring-hydroxylating dioxygenase large terminal subunit